MNVEEGTMETVIENVEDGEEIAEDAGVHVMEQFHVQYR
jgi:hypothetical protein